MTILVTGAGGQIGSEVVRALGRAGLQFAGYVRSELDLQDRVKLLHVIRSLRPSLVVNCAAYTAVDRAEAEPKTAFAVNSAGTRALAAACREAGAALLHFSTDYVFAGTSSRPLLEEDSPGPLNVYGRSKLAGEKYVRRISPRHLIIRTSWVFGQTGANFVRSILSAMSKGEALRIVQDQRGCPTPARSLGEVVATLVPRLTEPTFSRWGTYHFCGTPAATWYDVAVAVQCALPDSLAIRQVPIIPISGSERGGAFRPRNSVLDVGRARRLLGLYPPDWRTSLPEVVAAILLNAEPG